MPISGPASYLQTTDEFVNHWGASDVALGAGGPLVLPDGTVRAGLVTRRASLDSKRGGLQGKLNVEETAREDLNLKTIAIQSRLVQFNEKVRVFYANTKWPRALPELPSVGDSPNRFLDPLDDVANLWDQINADPGTATPVTLLGGYIRATFVADVAEYKVAHTALTTASGNVRLAREERNEEQTLIYAILKSYREAFPTYLAKTHPLFATLPRLTPLPGSTPSNVVATAIWDIPLQQARITWTASTEASLDHYEVRFCPGPNYSTEDESIVSSIDSGEPRELLTTAGLLNPGATASFKVYVVTTTGNESGSNAVTVNRPIED